MSESEEPKVAETSFHGVPYVISWRSNANVLVIDIEHDESQQRWHAEFQASYVESLTKKTGNFKKFDIFVRMLSKALEKPNNNVFADLLTVKDLEMLKSRKATVSSKSLSRRGPNEKRYLIITYVAAFDRIHYPLPLPVWENPNPQMLQRTIRRLLSQRTRETSSLPLQDAEHTAVATLQKQLKAVTAQRDSALAKYAQANGRLQELENGVVHNARSDSESVRMLKAQVESLELAQEEAIQSHRRIQMRRKKELENSLDEARKLREINRELRSRLRQGGTKAPPSRRSRSRTGQPSKPKARYSRSKPRAERGASKAKKRPPRTSSQTKRKPRARSFKRFDPSAYQRQREKRLSISRRRRNLRNTTGLSDRSFDSNRSRSRLRGSSVDSGYTSGESRASGRSRRSVGSTTSRASNRSRKKGRSSGKKPSKLPRTSRPSSNRSPALKENSLCKGQTGKSATQKGARDASVLAFAESTNRPKTNSSTAALELSDIDGRLSALQNFLKAAKSSTR